MRCDSRASLLAHNLASPCLGREPKARIVTIIVTWKLEHGVRKVVDMVKSFLSSCMRMQVLMQLMCLASSAKNMVKVYHLYNNVG
jgi:hypothetical protein